MTGIRSVASRMYQVPLGNAHAIVGDVVFISCGDPLSDRPGNMAIVDKVYRGFLVRLLFFHCMPASRRSGRTPGSRRLPLSVQDYHAF